MLARIPGAGTYVPTESTYARTFVFAMLLDCHGTSEVVTVQRSTGNLPVCEVRQPVEVVGRLIWNKALCGVALCTNRRQFPTEVRRAGVPYPSCSV